MTKLHIFKYLSAISVLAYAGTILSSHRNQIDERHILISWPKETVMWLKKHEVPQDLKKQIDAILLQEDVLQCLSDIYKYYNLAHDQLVMLEKAGFRFLDGKWTIFEISHIPGYIFKIAKPQSGRSELFNLARIAQANALKKSVRTWGLEKSIIIPKKYAYILPKTDTIDYKHVPKVIVVAQKIDLHQHTRKKLRHTLAKIWLRLKGMRDLKGSNLHRIKAGLALIDTEPWNAKVLVPGFSKKNHTCLTDQGLVVRS